MLSKNHLETKLNYAIAEELFLLTDTHKMSQDELQDIVDSISSHVKEYLEQSSKEEWFTGEVKGYADVPLVIDLDKELHKENLFTDKRKAEEMMFLNTLHHIILNTLGFSFETNVKAVVREVEEYIISHSFYTQQIAYYKARQQGKKNPAVKGSGKLSSLIVKPV